MNNNIQFAKIGVRKQSRAHQTALVFLGVVLLAVLSFFTVLSVRAYFTSTDTKSGELTFGTIEVKLLNGESEFTASSFQTKYLTGILPGSTLNFNSINVKNTGTHSAYVLLNLDVSIPSKDGNANKLLHYNKWFNANGEEVNTTNMAINQTIPTLIASGGSVTSNIQWKVPSIVGNDYKTSTVTVNMTAYGTQTNLKDAVAYANRELYASYFICSNASKIANDNGITYSGAEITTDPLRKIVNGKNLFDKSTASSYGYGGEIFVVDEVQCAKIYQTDGTYSISLQNIFKENTQYTLKFREKYVGTQGYVRVEFQYADGTSYRESYYSGSTWGTRTITSDANKTISKIRFSNAGNGVGYAYYVDLDSFQIEKGTTATTYEAYSAVEDTFDINTQTLTRNVAKYEFKGTEAIGVGYDEIKAESSAVLQFSMPNCAEVANYGTLGPIYCNRLENIKSAYISNSMLEGISVLPDANPYGGWLRWRIDVATYGGTTRANATSEFKNWLTTLYSQGNPFTVWFQMETPTTEKVLTSKNIWNKDNVLTYTGSGESKVVIDQPISELGNVDNQRLTISFRMHSENVVFSEEGNLVFFAIEYTDGTYTYTGVTTANYENDYVWFTTDAGKTVKSINSMNIHTRFISGSVIIKNIQIEVGVAPTDFECYDPH